MGRLAAEPLLNKWFNADDELAATKIIGDCPREILQMVAALVNLGASTLEHADDLRADGWFLKAEEADQRAANYQASINALVEVWGAPETDDDELTAA